MKVTARITRVRDGVTRDWPDDFDWPEESNAVYQWFQGNYSCDCNRHRFFVRAANRRPVPWPPCGESRYRVTLLETATGRVILADDQWREAVQ